MSRDARVSVTEAAARMGITPMALRMGLRHGRFPFGTAVKMERRWVYYISRERFERWMSGADMTVAMGRGGDDQPSSPKTTTAAGAANTSGGR